MLVLSRKAGEKIVIGDRGQVTISIIKLRGNRVQLSIEAPKEIPVMRQELLKDDKDPL